MINKLLSFLILYFIFIVNSFSQAIRISETDEVFVNSEKNDSNHPCISQQEYIELERQCRENIHMLGLDQNVYRNSMATSLNWPIRAAVGFNDCDYYFIAAYVDQDVSSGSFHDYDCGTNTYDGHHGTDIAAWPFGFYKMDNSQVEVIAAAPGTIVQKADGNFDRNCSSNSLTANSIIIQHADGSNALYWHMKENSVTTKTVGQTVVAGEYLGVVGSSGSASGPHLHFEVWSGSTNTTYNDPFSGTCNIINNSSWWASQRPHTNSAVVKVSVNTTDIVLPACPTTETPNESDVFAIPFQGPGLSPGYAKFYIFIRDDVSGLTADCKILNPNGSTFSNWTYTSTANNKTYIKGYSKLLPTIPGTYTFQVVYNGATCSKQFEITQAAGLSEIDMVEKLQVLQNPTSGSFTIEGKNVENGNYKFILSSITGQCIFQETEFVTDKTVFKKFSVEGLQSGIYFLNINSEKFKAVKKIIVQH